jgi:hypothetical protein
MTPFAERRATWAPNSTDHAGFPREHCAVPGHSSLVYDELVKFVAPFGRECVQSLPRPEILILT